MNKPVRGVALISVLLVMATAVTLLSWVISRQWLDLRRTSNLLEARQAHYYALAGETFARQLLAADRRDNEADHRGELWAQPMEPLEIETGALRLSIDDLQGRFNINNLVDPQGRLRSGMVDQFRRLLSALGLPERYAAELEDWMDRDDRVAPMGAEDSDYGERSTAGGWITAVAELRRLKSMEPGDFNRLASHLSAVPAATPINVNTATAEVLQSLSPRVSASRARSLVARQRSGGWESVSAFIADAGIAGEGLEPLLSVDTQHFQIIVEAHYARQRGLLTSTLLRRRDTRGIQLQILSRQHLVESAGIGDDS